jgi:hypothetical protein
VDFKKSVWGWNSATGHSETELVRARPSPPDHTHVHNTHCQLTLTVPTSSSNTTSSLAWRWWGLVLDGASLLPSLATSSCSHDVGVLLHLNL